MFDRYFAAKKEVEDHINSLVDRLVEEMELDYELGEMEFEVETWCDKTNYSLVVEMANFDTWDASLSNEEDLADKPLQLKIGLVDMEKFFNAIIAGDLATLKGFARK